MRSSILSAIYVTLSLISIGWVINLPLLLGLALTTTHYLSAFLALTISAVYLRLPYRGAPAWVNDVLSLAGFAAWAWTGYKSEAWLLEYDPSGLDKWGAAAVALVLLLEALRKSMGWGVTIVVGVFAAYAFLGHALPDPLTTAAADPRRIAVYFYTDYNGVLGMVLNIAATIIMAFILFSKTLSEARATEFFDLFATSLFAPFRGGAAKVAVVSSMLFGLVSGSVIGNIMTSGSMTIPMMKRAGFPARYAAAIESVASNAGQITPPIMGATAFLIAQFLQIPYAEIVVAAAFPALLIYVTLFVQIDSYAAYKGITGSDREQVRARRLIRTGLPFVLAMSLLVGLIFLQGKNIASAALLAAAGTFALHLILERGRGGIGTLFRILRGAAEEMLAVLVIAAAAGLLIGALNFTGLGFRMTLWLSFIAETAGLLPMLITTAVLCVLLGMGMPTAAVYILLSAILGPSLIHVGVDALAAHMFIFYFGLLSMLTPPVAIASYTAAGLAGAKLGETSLIALRFAAVAFLLPFLFVYEPALIGREGAVRLLMVGVPVLIASIALAWSLVGSMGGRVFRRPVFRPVCAVAAVAVSVVALFNTTIGFAGAVLLVVAVYVLSAGQKASCVGQGLSGRP